MLMYLRICPPNVVDACLDVNNATKCGSSFIFTLREFTL